MSASAARIINQDHQIISTYQEECGVCFSCKDNQSRPSDYFNIPRRMRCLLQLQAQSMETIKLFQHTKKNAVSASAASTINGDHQIISTYQEECGVGFSCKDNQLRPSSYFHIPSMPSLSTKVCMAKNPITLHSYQFNMPPETFTPAYGFACTSLPREASHSDSITTAFVARHSAQQRTVDCV